MLIDMHLHALPHSADSRITLEDIVAAARARGLDAVCITDHESMGLRERAAAYSAETGFLVLVGLEYFSLQGDITAYGIESFPDRRVDAQAFIDLVNAQGGFCASCHPFRNNDRGLEEHVRSLRGLHGIEVLNGSTDMAANRRALARSRELGLQPLGASDAHVVPQVGKYVTWLPERVGSMRELVQLLHSRPVRPALWNGSGYDVVDSF